METLPIIINSLLEWCTMQKEQHESRFVRLEQQLIQLYHQYFRTPDVFDANDYPDPPPFPEQYKQNIKLNFPEFDFYNVCLNLFDPANPENATGDALDDITDILSDVWKVKWHLENNSIEHAYWIFRFGFESHTREHVIGLLWYMSEYRYRDMHLNKYSD